MRRPLGGRALAAGGVAVMALGVAGLGGGGPLHALRALALGCPTPSVSAVGVAGSTTSGHAPQGATVVITGSNLDTSHTLLCSSTIKVSVGGTQFSIDTSSSGGSSSSQSFVL